MAKKIKLKIKFNNQIWLPDFKSSENSELLKAFHDDLPLVKKWTKEEKFSGLLGSFNHLDHLTLSLCTKESDKLNSILSGWSNYNILTDSFTDISSLFISKEESNILLNGEMSVEFGIKDVLRTDFIQFINRLELISLSFRVKNFGDLITLKKYGADWELEKQKIKAFINDSADDFVDGNPIVELISY